MGRLSLYLRELRREFQRINWPNRRDAVRMSLVVIVISLAMAAFLGLLDYIFSTVLQRFVI
ncbi:MAG: preprotein translocase subunit SecE [Candidatus Colwellbacteria bacterium]|nr:preprotein translocase subunit SecE [Candidatus Colwellbacteria bacterium]